MSTGTAGAEGTGLRSVADGGIVAEIRLDHEDFVLRPTLRRVPDVTVEPEYRTAGPGPDRDRLFLTARGEGFDAFEAALESDPTVVDPVLVDRYPDRRVYRVELADRVLRFTPWTADVDGRVLDVSGGRDGWTVRLRLPDRDALVSFNERCRDRGVSLRVDRLQHAGDDEDGVAGLTPKQRELLAVAYEEGYFDVPRGISQHELAERLGVSKSAISQRLRRAIAELYGSALARG